MSKFWILVTLKNQKYIVRLGDTVWFFPGCNMGSTPQCGTITEISEDGMVNIAIINENLMRRMSESGVCLFGSPMLDNPVHKNKGCWVPRTPVPVLQVAVDNNVTEG